MSLENRINRYLQGWVEGDYELLMDDAVDGYFFDDPNHGCIVKADFATYLEKIKKEAEGYRQSKSFPNFENLTDIVIDEGEDGIATIWFWWEIAGTPIEGASVVKFGSEGVLSETICYYGKASYSERKKAE
jgi:hypothetical protein